MTLKSVIVIGVASLGLVACGSNKIIPDEFEVVNRAPLVVPPEANLTPPRPGEPRAQEINPGRQAYEALFPGETLERPKTSSVSERELLGRLVASDPDVRSDAAGNKNQDVVKKTIMLADLLNAKERTYRPDNIDVNRVSSTSAN